MSSRPSPAASASKVAVLTPVYNGGAFLRETLESVQAQTYPNLVHIVINNASTDATADILADFADRTVPIVVVQHSKLLPQMENWNSAIEAIPPDATWFRMLCADDTIHPDAIEKTVALGESDPEIGFVGCKRDINGAIHDPLWPKDQTIFDGKYALKRFFENKGMIMGPHILVRAAAIEPDGPFYDLIENAADTDAALRVLTKWKMGFVHEHLAFTRVHDTTVTELEVSPLKLHLFDWYLFLHRYAASAFGPVDGKAMMARYRRHYVRRLINLRRSDPDGQKIWDTHAVRLARLGAEIRSTDFISATVDKGMIRAGFREDWYAYPW
jgi:glycosyltransferase involved in cell wall biosynthesis